MSPSNFLRQDAETPLCQHYVAAGAVCRFSTNCENLLQAAGDSFLLVSPAPDSVDFTVRFWIDDSDRAQPPWPKPYVRGVNHLVFAGFDSGSSLLADLRTRRVIGRFSAGMAADARYWRTVIFPMLLSVLAGSVGLVELHACCVAKDQRGLLLMGPSRSGKSTLALAMTEAGFRLLSDDRIFCSSRRGKLTAWGMPRPLKLRREAAAWFREFHDREPEDVQNGELVFLCEPNQRFGWPSLPACEPQQLVFLERGQRPSFCMTHMPRSEAKSRIEQDLMAEVPEAVQKQTENIEMLLALPCWRLQYAGRPQVIAEQLARLA